MMQKEIQASIKENNAQADKYNRHSLMSEWQMTQLDKIDSDP